MHIRFENLGPVRDATIDLDKRLTVFCGPNNTGKTYVGYALYGLLDCSPAFWGEPHFWIKYTSESIGSQTFEINSDTFGLLKARLTELAITIRKYIGIENEEHGSLVNFNASVVPSSLDLFLKDQKNKAYSVEKNFNSSAKIRIIKNRGEESIHVDYNLTPHATNEAGLKHAIAEWIEKVVLFSGTYDADYLPVERGSVFMFATDVLNSRLAPSKGAELTRGISRFPRAIDDYISIVHNLKDIRKRKSPLAHLADEIEKQFTTGTYLVDDDGEVRFTIPSKSGESVPFNAASSTVKTLAGLVLYLRHYAQPDELLIIDEPELNLHPDNQVRLARIFGRMVNEGIKLIISTHSDYIIREINNLIMLSTGSVKIMEEAKRFGYTANQFIRPSTVGVCYFNFNDQGEVVTQSLPVDDAGFTVPTIENEMDSMNERSEELFYKLKK